MDAAHLPARSSSLPLSKLSRVRWHWLLAAAVGYTTLVVLYTVFFGRLASYVQYDDVTYYIDALERLRDLNENGVGSFMSHVVAQPIHAPFSTLAAMLAFAIFGVQEWAPVAMNIVGVLLGLVTMERIFRRQGAAIVALSWLFWLCSPMAINGVLHFRPDYISALCAAIGTLYAARIFSRTSDRVPILAGVFFAGALLCKTTTFPLNLLALGTAVCASFWAEFFLLGRPIPTRTVLRRCALLILPLVALVLPHYIIARHEIYDYIYLTLYDARMGETLRYQKGLLGSVLYYVFGSSSQHHFGSYIFMVYPVLLLGTRWAIGQRRVSWRAAYMCSLLIVAAVMLLFLTALKHKSIFHGGVLLILVMFIAMLFVRFRLEYLRATVGLSKLYRPALVLAAILPVTIVVAPHRIAKFTPRYSYESEKIHSAFDDLFSELACLANETPDKPLIVYFPFTNTINEAQIRWMATFHRVPIQTRVDWLETDIAKQIHAAAQADVVIVSSNGGAKLDPIFPANHVQDELRAAIERESDFTPLSQFEATEGVPHYIYRNVGRYAARVKPTAIR